MNLNLKQWLDKDALPSDQFRLLKSTPMGREIVFLQNCRTFAIFLVWESHQNQDPGKITPMISGFTTKDAELL